MEKYLDKLDQLVIKEKYTIRPIHLVDLFNLHIKQAQFLLEQFHEKNKNLVVKYGLLGYQSDPNDEIGARRYVEIEKDDVEAEKAKFTKVISCTIKSVKDKDNTFDRLYDTGILNLQTNKDDLLNYQRKGFYINNNTNFREDQVGPLFKRLNIKQDDLNKPQKTVGTQINGDKQATVKEQQKTTKIIKPEAKPNNIFSSFKKAAATKPNDESTNGKNKEEKEFVKLKNDKMEDDSDDESTAINDVEMKEDEPIIKSSQKEKKSNASEDDEPVSKSNGQVKRSSKQIDSDSDEDFSKENVKHKKKKQRKRIAKVFDDSSSDEEQQMRKAAKILESDSDENESKEEKTTYKPPQEEVSSKLVEEEETYIDEEGYEATRKVKKIVKEEPTVKNEKIVNDTTNTKSLSQKSKESKPKKTDKETNQAPSDKKPTSKAKPQPKNQTSIMSFFKPKTQAK